MSIDISQFHQVFFEESFEGLDVMESALMTLNPESVDSETINSIFRAAHSIKGGSATFGFGVVADFTHVVETLLDQVRAGDRGISSDDVDLYLQSVDCLRNLLSALQIGEEPDTHDADQLKIKFEQLLTTSDIVESLATPQQSQISDDSVQAGGVKSWSITFIPSINILKTGNEPVRMLRELAGLGQVTVTVMVDKLPEWATLAADECYLYWHIELVSDSDRTSIEEIFEWVVDESALEITQQVAISHDATSGHNNGWNIEFIPGVDILKTGNEPLRMLRELEQLGPVNITCDVSYLPLFSAIKTEECYLRWSINLQSDCGKEQISEIFEWVEDESTINITPLSASIPTISSGDNSVNVSGTIAPTTSLMLNNEVMPAGKETLSTASKPAASEAQSLESQDPENQSFQSSTAKSQSPKSKAALGKNTPENSSIRVGIDKVDNLINMVGELVITQSMLGQLGADFSVDNMPKLLEGLSQLEHNTRELQESVMRIRMLPISFAFSRFPRMVRDLSKRLDKKINLVLLGEQTELDKTVMEKIGDPLVHLVRNSVDHGIESEQDRINSGKEGVGTIILNAYHQGGNVVIEITDDGKGLQRDKLLEKAIDKGIVLEKDAADMSNDQVYDLIFHPGFSTASEVSDVSGRGVGMDVVRRNIQELNGTIELASTPGQGSKVTIRLPLTLAILDGQLVRIGNQTYIFPLVSIIESLQISADRVNHVAGGCEVFQLRNEYVPIVRLYEVFHIDPDSCDIEDSLLVVVENDGEKVGVVVDDLEAQQQVVIKSLEKNYQRIEGVSGATILGDGTVALILDIPGLVKLAGVQQQRIQKLNRTVNGVNVQSLAS